LCAAAEPLPAPGIHSYFRALALRALGDNEAAVEVFRSLADFADEQMNSEPKLDYFATSLPNMLLFHDDLPKRKRVESLLLSALASHGLGDLENALELLNKVVAEDPNHLFAAEMFRSFVREAKMWFEVHPAS
jgi:tetratricopeptide (TPR) repeat protein